MQQIECDIILACTLFILDDFFSVILFVIQTVRIQINFWFIIIIENPLIWQNIKQKKRKNKQIERQHQHFLTYSIFSNSKQQCDRNSWCGWKKSEEGKKDEWWQ